MRSLNKAAAKIVQEAVATVEIPPADFSGQYNLKRGIAGSATLASLGALGGASVGIAMFGTAFSGAWVFAPALGIVGLLAGRTGGKST